MESIYLDNHLLVVRKLAGVTTQPDLVDSCKLALKKQFAKPGAVFLEPIHRLDRPVEGLVLFARTSKALSRLNEAMRGRKISKTYVALVEDHLAHDTGVFEHLLTHGEFRAHVVQEGGKQARLSYIVLERFENATLVEITLETGRYHQIRAQFSKEGHPIVGDKKYGSSFQLQGEGIALCHIALSFHHPVTGQLLELKIECTEMLRNLHCVQRSAF